jgi:hypothetical protein
MAMIDADLQAAFDYTFPLYEMARTRYLSVELPANPNRGVNRLSHRRALADFKSRAVTTPNNDTLYSSAWLDLAAGPIELTVPPMGGRYWSFQFMDAYSSTAELIGSRNAGPGDVKLWVVHAQDTRPAPAGVRVVRLPTRDVWLLVRILVDDASDAQGVHKLQDAITLRVVGDGAANSTNSAGASATTLANAIPPKAIVGSPVDGGNYLNVVNSMLARNAVPGALNLVARWQPLGVSPGELAPPQAAAQWTAALPDLNASVKAGVSSGARQVQGWQYPDDAVGVYGGNYRLRAAVALGGLGALPTVEAVYLSALADAQGRPLNGKDGAGGQAHYRVKIGADGIPAQAFWSLSMYQIEPDGRLFFVDNPAARYAVGDRTPGLVKNADGAMDIVVQHAEPAGAADRANWLPAPAGPFRLMLRAYLPSEALRQGSAPLPRVERAP